MTPQAAATLESIATDNANAMSAVFAADQLMQRASWAGMEWSRADAEDAVAERVRIISAALAAGGRIAVETVQTPLRTVLMESVYDAAGNCVSIRNAGEIWGMV